MDEFSIRRSNEAPTVKKKEYAIVEMLSPICRRCNFKDSQYVCEQHGKSGYRCNHCGNTFVVRENGYKYMPCNSL